MPLSHQPLYHSPDPVDIASIYRVESYVPNSSGAVASERIIPGLVEVVPSLSLVSDADAHLGLPVSNVEGIHKPAALEPRADLEWFNNNIELGVRQATMTLYEKGFDTFTSGANKDNFGQNRLAEPHIGIRFDPNNGNLRVFLERAAAMNVEEQKAAVESNRKIGFNISFTEDGNGVWNGIYINLDGSDEDQSLESVSSSFSWLVGKITEGMDTIRPIADRVEINQVEDNPYDKLYDPAYDNSHIATSAAETSRTRNIWEILSQMHTSEYGMKSFAKDKPEAFEEFERSLVKYGITSEPLKPEIIEQHRRMAESRVRAGTAEAFLRGKEYTDYRSLTELAKGAKKHLVEWTKFGPLLIDSSLIESVGDTFTSWAGRPDHISKTYMKADGSSKNGTVIDAVTCYAAEYSTQLPKLETNTLNMLLTKDGVRFYATQGANRIAAAKLRGDEPLRFTSLVVHDNR